MSSRVVHGDHVLGAISVRVEVVHNSIAIRLAGDNWFSHDRIVPGLVSLV